MVAAFGTTKPRKRDPRWITDYPRLDRGTMARLGKLQPGMQTEWMLKTGPGVASAMHVSCTALPEGFVLRTGDKIQVVNYWYETMPCPCARGSLRQFLKCPSCGAIRRTIYFGDDRWGCRQCLQLSYPIKAGGRILVASQIAGMQRRLIKVRPGSREWHELRARIADRYAALTMHVARIRRDLTRRLKRNHNRTVGENPVRADRKSATRSDVDKFD